MKPLSEQLANLSVRAKNAEDAPAAAHKVKSLRALLKRNQTI
jgi:hypothetical protein